MQNKLKSKRIAVVDLGTNTFHLVIANCTTNGWTILHKEKNYVRLGAEGLGHISQAASQRAERTLLDFTKTISSYHVDITRAFGTAAIRSADNQHEFVADMLRKTGINISVISGKIEAKYIHQGVLAERIKHDDNFIIMDIGGGSIEYIHSCNAKSIWFNSYNTGIAEAYKLFPPDNPISYKTIEHIHHFLSIHMSSMNTYWKSLGDNIPTILYGASGSFEVLFDMLSILHISEDAKVITTQQLNHIYNYILPTTSKDRLNMEFIPPERKELIVMALIIIKYVMDEYGFQEIKYASYALKEGVLAEYCHTL